jgi:hypothetical protein
MLPLPRRWRLVSSRGDFSNLAYFVEISRALLSSLQCTGRIGFCFAWLGLDGLGLACDVRHCAAIDTLARDTRTGWMDKWIDRWMDYLALLNSDSAAV